MTSNDFLAQVGSRIRGMVHSIWNMANLLAGPFKFREYALVILPEAVVNCVLDGLRGGARGERRGGVIGMGVIGAGIREEGRIW